MLPVPTQKRTTFFMARDPGLEALLEADLEGVARVTTKSMFGGLAWLVDGHLLCGARTGRMMLRAGREHEAEVLCLPGIEPMGSGPRAMSGWVWLFPEAYGDDTLRRRLLQRALDLIQALPATPREKKSTAKRARPPAGKAGRPKL